MDWPATLLELGGAQPAPDHPWDGISLASALREPQRLQRMRAAWEAWNAGMPPIPADAGVSLGYSVANMPQR